METEKITSIIISSAWEVWRLLGPGFLENVYKHSLAIELRLRGLKALVEERLTVYYKTQNAGNFYADLFVEDKVIVETKTALKIVLPYIKKAKHYLRVTGRETGLVISFNDFGVQTKRIYNNYL